MNLDVEIRPLAARDSIKALTDLLHRAYAPLAARGLHLGESAQTVEVTARRAAEGQCLVAVSGGRLVGTVTVGGPFDVVTAPWHAEAPWFRERDTAHFHQFAVDPGLQRRGLGRRLVTACEQWARERGYRWMVLDIAQQADEMHAMYRRLGYADVGEVQWGDRAHRSVVMRRSLQRSPLREQLLTMARYHAWATERLLQHVAALPEDDYRRDAGLFFRSVHGTLNHLLLAEQLLWYPRFADGVSPRRRLDEQVHAERGPLSAALAEGAPRWAALIERFDEARFDGRLDYVSSAGQALSLPFAATLMHVFNHATHHRGQVTAALTAMGHACPELDLVMMLLSEQAAAGGPSR